MPAPGQGRPACETNVDWTALRERFRQGDEEAFRRLLERHAGDLRARIASRVPAALRRRISPSDVMQETCILAFARHADFEDRGDGSFAAWMRAIADRKLREEVRRHNGASKRSAGREVTRGERPDTALFRGRGRSPSSAAMESEESLRVRAAMQRLREDDRTVLHLTLERGLTLREAAERMGRSRDAAKKLYGRALVRLREIVDESADGA